MLNNIIKETLLGPLPKEWEVVQLRDVFIEVDKRVRDFVEVDASKFEVLSLTKNSGLIPQSERFKKRIATEDVSDYKVVIRGNIVYNPYVIWEGAIHILRNYEQGLVSPVYPVLEAKNGVADPHYLDDMLRTPLAIAAYNRFAAGAVNRRRAISKRDFGQIHIPLPPLPEQRLIAHVLSTVRRSIEATERVIAAARELKRSLMKYLFTYGPVPIDQADQVVLKETEVGEVPEGWCLRIIDDVAHVNAESRDPRIENPEEDFIYIDISSVRNETGQIISPSRLLGKDAPSRARRVIHTKDVILSTVRPYLKAFTIIPNEYDNQICSTGFAVLTPRELASPEYLYYVSLSDLVGHQFIKLMKGASYPAINSGDVKETKIPIPTRQEQKIIGHHILSVDQKVIIETQRKFALEALFNSLLHHLMTGKIRVPPYGNA